MRLLIRAGTSADPRSKLGLAKMVSSLLDQGTGGSTPRTSQEMNDDIDFLGGSMGAGAATDLTFCNMVVMKDSFETGMRMLSDMARVPAFSQKELERPRPQMVSGPQGSPQGPEYNPHAVFDRPVLRFPSY